LYEVANQTLHVDTEFTAGVLRIMVFSIVGTCRTHNDVNKVDPVRLCSLFAKYSGRDNKIA